MAQSESLYRRIASDLRDQIRTGVLSAGLSSLPPMYTVRLALGILANEGAITSTPGRGTFVRRQAVTSYHASWAESQDRMGSDQADAYRAEVTSQGHEPGYRDFDMRIVPADAELARRLRVEHDSSVVSRGFVRTVDDEPSSLQDSYYPMDIAQECGLITPHDIPQGTIRDEARRLRLGAGAPVLVYARTTYTKTRPVRVTLTIFAGDRNRVIYELGDLTAFRAGDQGP